MTMLRRAGAPQRPGRRPRAERSTVDTTIRLVRDARKACKIGDTPRASENARAALELLRYLQ